MITCRQNNITIPKLYPTDTLSIPLSPTHYPMVSFLFSIILFLLSVQYANYWKRRSSFSFRSFSSPFFGFSKLSPFLFAITTRKPMSPSSPIPSFFPRFTSRCIPFDWTSNSPTWISLFNTPFTFSVVLLSFRSVDLLVLLSQVWTSVTTTTLYRVTMWFVQVFTESVFFLFPYPQQVFLREMHVLFRRWVVSVPLYWTINLHPFRLNGIMYLFCRQPVSHFHPPHHIPSTSLYS